MKHLPGVACRIGILALSAACTAVAFAGAPAAVRAAIAAEAPLAGTAARIRAESRPAIEGLARGASRDSSVLARIRAEGLERSRVLETAIMLSDVHGPRLAGSRGYFEAAEWARDELASYGLIAGLEPWGQRHGYGWILERHSVEILEPYYARIVAYPKAWSPPTDGVIRGRPLLVDVREEADLEQYRGQLEGRIVLNGAPPDFENRFEPLARRYSDAELDSLAALTDPGSPRTFWEDAEGWLESIQRRHRLAERFREEGVSVLLEPSANSVAVRVGSYHASDQDVSGTVPAFVVDAWDYARLVNIVERAPLALEVELRTGYEVRDTLGYNVVAELPGGDAALNGEVVMVGAHLDSWPAGTGATDNAAGAAVAMEALRILNAVDARPRRTIRLGLWDAEEQEDYFGSLGYVRHHLGDPETMRHEPGHARMSAYFNVDHGTGRIRGIYLQGQEELRPVFASYLEPLADLGASTLSIANRGSTDHMSFVAVGIPAFTFIHDPIDYFPRTHHSRRDVAAALIEDDLKQAAVVVASILFQVADRDEMLPRPALPAPRR